MEGKATLTLTDAKSGRVVKKVTEHNLVTDAVKRILNPPVYAMLYSFNFPNFINNVMPASKLFSGIMLLGNTLSESRENVMLSGDYIPVATAGGEYAGANVRRGTLNTNESYATANGYHFTWDFGEHGQRRQAVRGSVKYYGAVQRDHSVFPREGAVYRYFSGQAPSVYHIQWKYGHVPEIQVAESRRPWNKRPWESLWMACG